MNRERETKEAQIPHCPMCDRSLEGVNDYPKIIIRDLTVSAVTNVNHLRNQDEGDLVKGLSKDPKVKDYLVRLTAEKGNIIKLSDIKPDLPPYEDRDGVSHNFFKIHKIYYLNVDDSNSPSVARVLISKHINSGNLGWGFLEVAEVAKIKYAGVLNEPPENLLRGMF